jgi:hypothetical protein
MEQAIGFIEVRDTRSIPGIKPNDQSQGSTQVNPNKLSRRLGRAVNPRNQSRQLSRAVDPSS